MKKASKKKFNYFDAFEKQSAIASKQARLLLEVVENFSKAEDIEKYLPRAHELESRGDSVCHDVFDAILPDFVTPIDREDIISLTNSMDALIDKMEEVLQRFYMYDIHFMHHDVKPLAKMIVKSCDALSEAMADFRNCNKSKKFKQLVIKVNDIENEADAFHIKAIRKLYTHDRENPVRVLVWTSLFDMMEECVDLCETIADKMNSIMLKNG
jgi:uncharacterized protein